MQGRTASAWSYKKKKHKIIEAYSKSIQKEPTVEKCLLILGLKPFRSQIKENHSTVREFQSLAKSIINIFWNLLFQQMGHITGQQDFIGNFF